MTGPQDTASLGAKLQAWYHEVWGGPGAAELSDPEGKARHPELVSALCRLLHLDPGLARRGLDPSTMLSDALAVMHGRRLAVEAEAEEVVPRVKAVLRAAYSTPPARQPHPSPVSSSPSPSSPQRPSQSSPLSPSQSSPVRSGQPPFAVAKRPLDPTAFRSPPKRPRADAEGGSNGNGSGSGNSSGGKGCLRQRLVESVRDAGWREVLAPEFAQPYFDRICGRLEQAGQAGEPVLPAEADVFRAFDCTPWAAVRVVLLGQDPYPGAGQAHGLAFSVRRGVAVPASLRNVYEELRRDVPGYDPPPHGNLEAWARQGVLLLNASLTVAQGRPNSHAEIGWQTLTDAVIRAISDRKEGVVFLLWGGFARKKKALIDLRRHRVVEAAHPSPNSVALWQNCGVFSKTNAELRSLGQPAIDWQN